MLLSVAIAGLLMVVTTAIHASGMMLAMRVIRKNRDRVRELSPRMQIYRVSGIVVLMFVVSLLEVLVWAAAYLTLSAIEGIESAVYFSMVTFTTLGYGDIVLAHPWRLLASFEAANGIIMFGWTTAIVIATVELVYFPERWRRSQT